MKLKRLIQLFSLLLAINFTCEVVLDSFSSDLVQIEIDLDVDSEKEESKGEKESDKINLTQIPTKFGISRKQNRLAIHHCNCWISPVIETNSPPPEVV